MSLSLDIDHHVDAAITRGLRRRGGRRDHLPRRWDDDLGGKRLLGRATQLGRVLFTQDDDHLAIAHRWAEAGRGFAGLIYAHPLDLTIGRAVHDLELMAKAYDPVDIRDRVEFLPL